MPVDLKRRDGLPPYRTPDHMAKEQGGFEKKIRGSCHCGKIIYWISRDKPLAAKFCHCSDCKTIHGAPFQWAAIFHKTDMAFDGGIRGLRFYNSRTREAEHQLPCKVGCAYCGSSIMDEGRNMVLLFPTLLALDDEQRKDFKPQCHIFWSQRVVDIVDDLPKWEGLDEKSTLLEGKAPE
ncbi:hypothetical protein HIM_08498 [Hirsutella minnesotensis 3608]|uniref:CENP-V/GFA domain-containing protein n=1 Tax=Hirsutella minnesotensis 3608 TaxID=1043627 RepID=A0A0F7ZMJ8_9HYPO|nr:hypothetical protein HIM_08498 [Hirsutella minnesotensis 3608]